MRAITTISGKSFAFATLSGGNSSVAVTPTGISGGRTTNVVKAFEYYRFTKLRFRFLPGCTSSVAFSLAAPRDFVCGWAGEVASGSVSYSNVLEFQPNTHFSAGMYSAAIVGPVYPQTTPSSWAVVSKRQLTSLTDVKWWRTQSGATTDPDYIQGVLYIFSDSSADTGVYKLELDYTCEFTGPNANSVLTDLGRSLTSTLEQIEEEEQKERSLVKVH